MSEKLRSNESQSDHEKLVSQEHQAEVIRHKQEQARQAQEKADNNNVETLRRRIAEEAPEKSSIKLQNQEKDDGAAYGSHHLLKKASYKQTMAAVRHRLPRRLRSFSKLVHNPAVEAVSNASAKTVARPSGLLGGGIGAFAGSAFLLYVSKAYGFSSYNYGLFLMLFAGGFVAGLAIELLVWALWHGRKV